MYALTLDGSEKVVHLPAKETVLDACLARGLELPYNCRSGALRNCKAVPYGSYLAATQRFLPRPCVPKAWC